MFIRNGRLREQLTVINNRVHLKSREVRKKPVAEIRNHSRILSKHIHLRLSRSAARPVLREPAKGSTTSSFSSVRNRMKKIGDGRREHRPMSRKP